MVEVITPARREALIREVAQGYADRLERELNETMDQGFLFWGREKPQVRLQDYLTRTLPQEEQMVLNPGFVKAVAERQMPPWTPDETGKASVSPFTGPLWGPLSYMPGYVLQRFASDFRSLLVAERRKLGEPMLLPAMGLMRLTA